MAITSETIIRARSLVGSEMNTVANMANISALLTDEGGWHWVGFYVVDQERNELVLGPFQGPIACTRLKPGRGVCARSWQDNSTLVVNDVHSFEGHVACSEFSKSEVVIPIRVADKVVGVLDIDSVELDGFSDEEVSILEAVVKILEERWVG
jgi:L-methionine (R)-S-oxide reductase